MKALGAMKHSQKLKKLTTLLDLAVPVDKEGKAMDFRTSIPSWNCCILNSYFFPTFRLPERLHYVSITATL